MDAEWDELFTVDEIMGGLPSRRASMVLFAIEGRTGQIVGRSRRAMSRDFSGRTAEQEEQAFLSALVDGAALPVEPSIQDLERYAPDWESLVPSEPSIRAALAKLLSEKYRIPFNRTAQLQHAVGLDDAATQERFQELYGVSVSSIFVSDLHVQERLQWWRSNVSHFLESLPPFWTAFSLTLTETVGAGVLALPIAFAELGVLGALVVLLALGAVNILTIAAMTEAVARNGDVRYGRAYFGRLVREYLGQPGLMILVPALLVLYVIATVAYAIGISSTLSDSIGFSPLIWLAGLLVVMLFFLRKDSLDATIASALVIGLCSISLLLLLSLLAAPHLTSANLRYGEIPFVDGNAFDAGIVELIFGVALLALFGHTATANCAAVVLRQDPTARSLILGAAAGLGVATMLYMFWVLAVNGAVGPEALSSERGTALAPLSDIAGPAVAILGTLFVILAMGMASVHMGWGLVKMVGEWLPPTRQPEEGSSVLSRPGNWRFAATFSPLLAIFLLVAVLFALDRESFTGPLGFLGVVTVPLVSGIFSMLMLAAARQKGDCTVEYGWRFLGNRLVVGALCVFFLAAVLVHGLVIWSEPLQQAVAIGVSACTILFIIFAVRNSFVPRSIAEVRYPEEGPMLDPNVTLVARGKLLTGATHMMVASDGVDTDSVNGSTARTVDIRIPAASVKEMKVWVHQDSGDGSTLPIPAIVHLNGGQPFQLDGVTGRIVIPIDGSPQRLLVTPGQRMSSNGAS